MLVIKKMLLNWDESSGAQKSMKSIAVWHVGLFSHDSAYTLVVRSAPSITYSANAPNPLGIYGAAASRLVRHISQIS